MDARLTEIAQACLDRAEEDAMTFPQVVGMLMQAGFESYAVDFRRASATYYLPNGDSVMLSTHRPDVSISAEMDMAAVRLAIKEAQEHVLGYTYLGFCAKVMAAGCAGYVVSFTGRRAVYFGRTAETHVEYFPD